MAKIDTVGDNYYEPLKKSDAIGTGLFWIISVLSIAMLFIEKSTYPVGYDVIQIIFIISVLIFFLQGQVQSLYLFPRAEDKRRQQLLSNSYDVSLTHENTVGYYNNDQKNPLRRLAASIMESAFFTREIVRNMLLRQRIKTGGYLLIYIIAVFNRSTNLEFLAVAAQAVFSEEIIARWLRMEWLRSRSEQVFDNLNRLFISNKSFSGSVAQSQAIDLFSFYETTKSRAAVLLSSKLFHIHNPRLTEEWENIRRRLGI